MIKKIIDIYNKIEYKNEKKKLIMFGFSLLLVLFFSGYLFSISYARYQSHANLRANIDKAVFLFERKKMSFNIDSSKIVPSVNPYKYKFSIANYDDDDNTSDINITYNLILKTTTNMPLSYKLYKNTDLNNNILLPVNIKRDADGSYYRVYKIDDTVNMNYTDRVIDVYTLEVVFPIEYKDSLTYSDYIENIEVIIDASQKVD